MQARPAGYCQVISQPVFGTDALGFHEPAARLAVTGHPFPIDPGGLDIAGSTRCPRVPRAVDYVQQSVHRKNPEQAQRVPVRARCT